MDIDLSYSVKILFAFSIYNIYSLAEKVNMSVRKEGLQEVEVPHQPCYCHTAEG